MLRRQSVFKNVWLLEETDTGYKAYVKYLTFLMIFWVGNSH